MLRTIADLFAAWFVWGKSDAAGSAEVNQIFVGRDGFSIQAKPRAFFGWPIRQQTHLCVSTKVVFHLVNQFCSSRTFVARIGAARMTFVVPLFSEFSIFVSPENIEMGFARLQCACRIVEPTGAA